MKERKVKRIRSSGSHLMHNYKEKKFGFIKTTIDKKLQLLKSS